MIIKLYYYIDPLLAITFVIIPIFKSNQRNNIEIGSESNSYPTRLSNLTVTLLNLKLKYKTCTNLTQFSNYSNKTIYHMKHLRLISNLPKTSPYLKKTSLLSISMYCILIESYCDS